MPFNKLPWIELLKPSYWVDSFCTLRLWLEFKLIHLTTSQQPWVFNIYKVIFIILFEIMNNNEREERQKVALLWTHHRFWKMGDSRKSIRGIDNSLSIVGDASMICWSTPFPANCSSFSYWCTERKKTIKIMYITSIRKW